MIYNPLSMLMPTQHDPKTQIAERDDIPFKPMPGNINLEIKSPSVALKISDPKGDLARDLAFAMLAKINLSTMTPVKLNKAFRIALGFVGMLLIYFLMRRLMF